MSDVAPKRKINVEMNTDKKKNENSICLGWEGESSSNTQIRAIYRLFVELRVSINQENGQPKKWTHS